MLAKRLAIAVLLEKGYTYDLIDEVLKVSKATIATVHKQCISGAPGYKRAITHILNTERKENLWNELNRLILALSPPKSYGSVSWERKRGAGKRLAKRKRQLTSL